MASRHKAGESVFTFNEPLIEKNAATLSGLWYNKPQNIFPKACQLFFLHYFIICFRI